MTNKSNNHVSAIVVLEGGDDVENIWVRNIQDNNYEVCSIPFWAYNISLGDIVECHPDEDGEGLFIHSVVKKSGNRTVRVGFKGPKRAKHPEGLKFKNFLNRHHYDFDFIKPNLYSINIPSEELYRNLTERLEQVPESADMIWEDGDPQPGVNIDGSEQTSQSI